MVRTYSVTYLRLDQQGPDDDPEGRAPTTSAFAPGDRIEFVLTEDNTVLLKPATRAVTDLKGFLPKPPKPVSLDAMKAAIRKRAGR